MKYIKHNSVWKIYLTNSNNIIIINTLCICNVIYCYIMMLAGIKLCIPTQARSTDGHLPRSSWTSRPQAQGSSFKFYSAHQKKTDAVRASMLICSRHQIPTVFPSIRACAKGPGPLWKGKGWPPPNKNAMGWKLKASKRLSDSHKNISLPLLALQTVT